MANIDSVKLPNGNEYNLQDVVTPRDFTNPNLLINPWFTVNQRGVTSGSQGTTAVYLMDRWKCARLTYTWSSSGFSFAWDGVNDNNGFISQRIPDCAYLIGKKMTFSCIADGSLLSYTFTMPSSEPSFEPLNSKLSVRININGSNEMAINFKSTSTTASLIKAVKLEMGETSTLLHDFAPDYTTELLKCQRYFVRFKAEGSAGVILEYGDALLSSAGRFTLHLATPMRTTPTITFSGAIKVGQNGSAKAVTAISVLRMSSQFIQISATISSSDLTTYAMTTLAVANVGDYIDLSAEL